MRAERPFHYVTRTSVTCLAPSAAVFDVVTDLRAHLVWSGERASDPSFKLLSLDTDQHAAEIGTTFSSTGANFNGTFHDRSIVTQLVRPTLFTIETDARLERRRGETWNVRFVHTYEVAAHGSGSLITYTETIDRLNYVPYWLAPIVRSFFRPLVNRADRKQLTNLARLAEERFGTRPDP